MIMGTLGMSIPRFWRWTRSLPNSLALEGDDIQMGAFLDLSDTGYGGHRRGVLANPAAAPAQHVANALTQPFAAQAL